MQTDVECLTEIHVMYYRRTTDEIVASQQQRQPMHETSVCFRVLYVLPPIIILILTRSTQRAQTSADLEDPDFGLWTPRSKA